jgi:DNA-directed RNA polymerase subunit E'
LTFRRNTFKQNIISCGMFFEVVVTDHIRVEPSLFGMNTDEAVRTQLEESYSGFQDKEIGTVVVVLEVLEVKEGIIIPGDGAAYYESTFRLIVFRPDLQELVYGTIEEITSFGAFISLGPIRGMIHISQTMDDFVSFSDSGVLSNKDGKKNLVQGDNCIARVVAISYKGEEPKIGLTMRQPGLGKIEWVKAEQVKEDAKSKQVIATEPKRKERKK